MIGTSCRVPSRPFYSSLRCCGTFGFALWPRATLTLWNTYITGRAGFSPRLPTVSPAKARESSDATRSPNARPEGPTQTCTSFHTVGTAKTLSTALRVTTFAAFAGDCNHIMHALNSNDTWYFSFCPKSHSKAWRESFFLPIGMRIFSFEFYSTDSLWLHAYRRGTAFEIETTRRDSPTYTGSRGARWPPKGASPSTISKHAPPL